MHARRRSPHASPPPLLTSPCQILPPTDHGALLRCHRASAAPDGRLLLPDGLGEAQARLCADMAAGASRRQGRVQERWPRAAWCCTDGRAALMQPGRWRLAGRPLRNNACAAPVPQVTWRYCVLHFYERSYESGGRIFEILFTLVVRLCCRVYRHWYCLRVHVYCARAGCHSRCHSTTTTTPAAVPSPPRRLASPSRLPRVCRLCLRPHSLPRSPSSVRRLRQRCTAVPTQASESCICCTASPPGLDRRALHPLLLPGAGLQEGLEPLPAHASHAAAHAVRVPQVRAAAAAAVGGCLVCVEGSIPGVPVNSREFP